MTPAPLPPSPAYPPRLRAGRRSSIHLLFLTIGVSLVLALSGCLTIRSEPPTASPTLPPSFTPTFAFPTLPPTDTPTLAPSLTPTPDRLSGLGQVLFVDDFGVNHGWSVGQGDLGNISVTSGELVIVVRQPGAFRYALGPIGLTPDFFLEVTARSALCSAGDEYGVMFRVQPNGDHYRLTLTCDGGARVSRVLENQSIALIPVTQTYTVIPGAPAVNRLAILAVGDQYWFYINNFEAFSVRDGTLTGGGPALIVRSARSGQVTVAFDDLLVRAIQATPTPGTPTVGPPPASTPS
jgi:hypothetical protein